MRVTSQEIAGEEIAVTGMIVTEIRMIDVVLAVVVVGDRSYLKPLIVSQAEVTRGEEDGVMIDVEGLRVDVKEIVEVVGAAEAIRGAVVVETWTVVEAVHVLGNEKEVAVVRRCLEHVAVEMK
jgi:hypothetical protein